MLPEEEEEEEYIRITVTNGPWFHQRPDLGNSSTPRHLSMESEWMFQRIQFHQTLNVVLISFALKLCMLFAVL